MVPGMSMLGLMPSDNVSEAPLIKTNIHLPRMSHAYSGQNGFRCAVSHILTRECLAYRINSDQIVWTLNSFCCAACT